MDPQQHFEHLPEYQLVVCKTCKYAVWPSQIQQHYQGSHHKWGRQRARDLEAAVQSWPGVLQYPIELEVPTRVSAAIPALELHTDGLQCQLESTQCQYVCRRPRTMTDHLKQKHNWTQQQRRGNVSRESTERQQSPPWTTVHCQRFFNSRQGSQFFVVEQSSLSSQESTSRQAQSIVPVWQQASNLMDRAWIEAAELEARIITEGEASEVNPWLERTGWLRYLTGLDREKLSESITKPNPNDEAVADRMWSTMESLARYCQQTITSRVGHFVRIEAIRTEKHQTKYHPLQPYQNVKGFGDYVRAWQQVLMFFMRSADSKARQRQSDTWKMPKYRFTKSQRQAWRAFNDAVQTEIRHPTEEEQDAQSSGVSNTTEDASTSDDDAPLGELERLCLKFCIALLDHQISKHEYESPLVCALAVLGIHGDQWMGPDRYPPILSAMIKISRMMVIQQAWEECDHDSSRHGNSNNSSFASDSSNSRRLSTTSSGILQEVKGMMDRFMVRGSHGPMQWMLDLRTYGLKIHYNTTTEGHVDWDGDRIVYKQVQFTMSDFRSMVHGLVERTQGLLFDDLLFQREGSGLPRVPLPRIRWSKLRDNPADKQRRWNFIQDERNTWDIESPETWLWRRIEDTPVQKEFVQLHNQEMQWQQKGIDNYMEQIVEFREKLLVLMHFTGGQPARAPEILSVRHCNTTRGEHRNIFVENGLVVFVTRGHKGYSMKGDVKVIHRYLPQEVGMLLVYYLLLVLPFQQRLELAVWKSKRISAVFWPADPQGRQFTSERMRKCIKRQTQIGMGVGLTIQMYREISIAMSRRWVRKQDAFRMDEDDEDGEWNEDDSNQIADEQAGHTSHVAGMIYARGIMERSGEVASKRERFREA